MTLDLDELYELACRGNNAVLASDRDVAADYITLIASAREAERLRERVADLERDHERELQDAYEGGLLQQDGPDELGDEMADDLKRTYDRYHAGTYGEHVDDVQALQCIITKLQDRLSVRSRRIAALERETRLWRDYYNSVLGEKETAELLGKLERGEHIDGAGGTLPP